MVIGLSLNDAVDVVDPLIARGRGRGLMMQRTTDGRNTRVA
jgi:hypothetical protein